MILLGAVVAISGVFSAFLVNDAICLVLAPLVLDLTARAWAASRCPICWPWRWPRMSGSTATITGNPQNIMIGSFSQIPYASFAAGAGAGRAGGLIITVRLDRAAASRRVLPSAASLAAPQPDFRVNRALVIRALLATVGRDRAVLRRAARRPRRRSSSAACCC